MITRDKDGHALLNNDTKTDAGERTNKVCDDAITILERNMKGKKPGELIFTSSFRFQLLPPTKKRQVSTELVVF